jgi:hypothetical protein
MLDYDGLPERECIFGQALLDPGDRRVGTRLEEGDDAEVDDREVSRAGVLH